MHHPLGITPGDLLDPQRITQELNRALGKGALNDQWAWIAGAFSDPQTLGSKTLVLSKDETACDIDFTTPSGSFPATDPNVLTVPYNSGVDAGATVSWDATVPELVLIVATAQYYRELDGAGIWAGASFVPRVQIGIEVDGVVLEGSGPWGRPVREGNRGAGLGDDSAAYTGVLVQVLPPGAHTVRLVAGQAPCETIVPTGVARESLADILPTDGVYLGSRGVYAFRFAMGMLLGGT